MTFLAIDAERHLLPWKLPSLENFVSVTGRMGQQVMDDAMG